ncbi:hypothetical protein AJ80_05559 [Polytolypa hystricis UAMH7299]|uniref:ATP synthase mitochondrial F1 complex assembly factor 1 n=1 Tax=Polytolypa hystricis (strain UAMH7299) TaxID=1447883 RepID=A0A2B7Y2G1_POLH7|nr:hypothetical protein AJ80_05559 [Polytolypa hystricis UAMH7299]
MQPVVSSSPAHRVYDRYYPKLERHAKRLGLANVRQLWDAHRDQIEHLKRQDYIDSQLQTEEYGEAPLPAPFTPPPVPPAPQAAPKLKTLAAYLDLDKVRHLGCAEIETVWRLRHASSQSSLCATIPSETFKQMVETARAHPRFVLPLPTSISHSPDSGPTADGAPTKKPSGVSFHFIEWAFPSPTAVTVIMTHLAEFKTKGEFAVPHTAITHHLELSRDKGVVLLQGAVTEHMGMSVEEARWLLMMLQKFYGGVGAPNSEPLGGLLEDFTAGNEAFNIQKLVEEAERIR